MAAGTDDGSPRRWAGWRARLSPLLVIYLAGLAAGAVFAMFALSQLRSTSSSLGRVLSEHTDNALELQRLSTLSERLDALGLSYLLTGDPAIRGQLGAARDELAQVRAALRTRVHEPETRRLVQLVEDLSAGHESAVDRAMTLRDQTTSADAVSAALDREVQPARDALVRVLSLLGQRERQAFEETRATAMRSAHLSFKVLLLATGLAAVVAAALLLFLVATVRRLRSSREQLATALLRLEERNRDLDAFAARVAHDVRNVLTPIALSAGRILAAADAPEPIRGHAGRIQRITSRTEGWIDSLLAFSRAASAADPQAAAPVRAVVADVLEQLGPQAAAAGVLIETEVEELSVACPAPLLNIVVANLVGNAIKFLDGEHKRVSVQARRNATVCELLVADTGPGIPAEAQARIFDPFYRAPGSHAPGSGLGLATVRRIVEGHGGSVALESKRGEGACFILRLPLAARDREALAATAPLVPAAARS